VLLATRGSPLALRQSETVAALLRAAHPGLDVELSVVRTRGDQDASTPLDQIGGQGVFVTEVETAVADGRADAAVARLRGGASTRRSTRRTRRVPAG
jgi:hydroxymethylbilane synthase